MGMDYLNEVVLKTSLYDAFDINESALQVNVTSLIAAQ